MNLLAIDAATEKFSVALGAASSTWLFQADAGLRHSELLMDCIDTLFKTAGLGPNDLSGVVCTGGPGSFTGLRIGFSVAKGLALSLDIPFAAIPTLDCMARPLRSWPGIVVPVLDAKKKAFFCALYEDGKKLCPDMDAEPVEIAEELGRGIGRVSHGGTEARRGERGMGNGEWGMGGDQERREAETVGQAVLFGPGAVLLYEGLQGAGCDVGGVRLGKDIRWGNAETLLQIAVEKNIFANNVVDYSIGPEYIRKSDAEIQKNL